MRQQYFFRPSPRGLLAWDVTRLVQLTSAFPRTRVPLTQIRELDEPWHADHDPATWRDFVYHATLMGEADASFPIILAADGTVMDGMHRVAKALQAGRADIEAVQFDVDPPPDHVGKTPEELPY